MEEGSLRAANGGNRNEDLSKGRISIDHGDRYPPLVHVVDRAGLKSVQFSYRTDVGEVEERLQKLGTINLRPSPVKEASTRPGPLFSPDDVSADKLELRGGLWYIKGETKPFTGRVTLWTPGHGNEIARQVVKTYVNGKVVRCFL